MQYLGSLALLALVPSTLAQYDYGSGSSASATAATASTASASSSAAASTGTISVDVGHNGLVFNPNVVTAAVGAQVVFNFFPKNHSVAQSSFAAPCVPGASNIFSGFQPASGPNANSQTFAITINDTKPIWLYCSQANHCQSGMSMVINQPANSPNTLVAYQAAAQGTTSQTPAVVAGGSLSGSSSSGSGTTGTSPSSTSSASATASTAAAASTAEFGFGGLGIVLSAFAFAFGLLA